MNGTFRVINCVWLIASLAGCAQTQWTHPTKTQADFNRDKFECENEAAAYARDWGVGGNPMTIGRRTKECMASRGYVLQRTPMN